MDAKTWIKVKDIFSGIVDLDEAERSLKLNKICNGDHELRAEVVALLRSNDEVEDFIEEPAFIVSDALPPDVEPTTDKVIGHYRVVREIGRGGMGTVFLATRDDGEFKQEVAIKVVSSAFLGRESLRRFRQERQILAGLNHPNIARLLDGGVTDEGLPYLVMEFVEGEPLIEHADKHNLSIDERLRVFLKICRAFAYAHGNLIVHRDIKPSNILVTSDGDPKLLDFGLAKILDIESEEDRTATNFRALTPAYASPEQIRGDTITTASDIYSLGVVLYELLTGSRPFNYESATFEKMIQMVSVSEPVLPSQAASRSRRGGEEEKRRRGAKTVVPSSPPLLFSPSQLKGDIDNIVLMAMRKEPERRYRSVEQLADDIERHLKGLPITASQDTFTYRSSKFIRRHWIGVASAVVIILVLIAGIITTSWQARAARRAQARSETIGAFLQNMLGSAAPEAKGSDVKVKDILAEAATRARTELADDPEAMAQVLLTLGRTYVSLTLYGQAEIELRAAAEASEKANGISHPTTAASLAWLGIALAYEDKFVEGETVSMRAVELERNLHPDGSEDLGYALFGYAANLMQKGDAATSLKAAREASEDIKQSLGEQHGYYLATINQTALANDYLGNLDEAERLYRQTLVQADSVEPRYRIFIAQAALFMGKLLIKKGNFDTAEIYLNKSETVYRDVLGDSNTTIAYIRQISGKIRIHRHDFNGAVMELRESLEMFSKSLPPENGYVLQSKMALGLALTRAGKLSEGEQYLREAQTAAAKTLPPASALRAEIESTLGECLTARGQFAEAETLLTGARAAEESETTSTSQTAFETKRRLSALYKAWNRPAESRKY